VLGRSVTGKKSGISGFRREVDDDCLLLVYYITSSNFVSTFLDNLSVPSSGVGVSDLLK
jgi:hypothetical protein